VISHLQVLIAYFSTHPQVALVAIFLAALLEAVALIGTVIPGSSVVFIGGVLIGLKVLNPWWTIGLAIAGAILGDGASYWLGHHYHEKIRSLWPMKNYPGWFARGQVYFTKNGGKSVFLGRFVGPLRAIVPVVEGMSDMPVAQFYAMNILSALAWAVAHILPGVLFGASLQLAGAVSARLVVLLVATLVFFWIAFKLVRFALEYAVPKLTLLRDRAVARARGESGWVARIILSLFDPARPESPALLIAAVLLVGGAWLFLGVLQDVLAHEPLVQADKSVYYLLQGLRTRWVDDVMVVVTELGGGVVTGAVVFVVSLWLSWKRYWRTLGYWLAAAGFAEMAVQILKFTLGRHRPSNLYSGVEQFSFPSGHATLSIVVYGFMAFLLTRKKSLNIKIAITLTATLLITLISFSRLYLGAHWFSDVLAGLSLGLSWVAVLGIAYTNHQPNETLHSRSLLLSVLTTLVLLGGWYVSSHHSMDVERYVYRPKSETLLLSDWKASAWRSLPRARAELDGDIEEPFSLQWVGSAEQIAATLTAAGWEVPQPWMSKSVVLWLLPDPPIQQLPVLPKFNQGEAQQLTFVRVINAKTRIVVRLWPLRYAVATVAGGASLPLWQGMVTFEHLRHIKGAAMLAETAPDFITPVRILETNLHQQGLSIVEPESRRVPVLLVW
jgi:membrane protein DedA with SNARE-associated domain